VREASSRESAPPDRPGRADVLQGTLDLMVLQTLETLGPLHGYAIAARLEQVSNGALQLNMGTLYPALMRLEQRRLVTGSWGTTDTNRKARFYKLTPAGRRELGREKDAWNRMAGIMHALLHGEG
jgi:PadR family transcriptional regulator, regulatory protein PadR